MSTFPPFPFAEEACPHAWNEGCMRVPAASGPQSQVYKDECVYCCHTNAHGEGIFVCMCCFVGVCRGHINRHREQHTTHSMYTVVKQILPPAPAATPEGGDTNQLGVSAPAEFESRLVCGECSVELTPGVGCSIESFERIVLSTSAGVQDAVNKNHLPNVKHDCPHIKQLTPPSSNPFASNALGQPTANERCANCDVSTNNWMCLTCGAIGCPRKEAGGNGHAIFHYMMTNHPIVFKVGTIVEGHGDLYCYACDDSIYDDRFRDHIRLFGIDSATAVKSAKTLGEMEYDISSRHDFNAATEAGSNLALKYGPGFTGMHNLGNSCYLAAVVQCFAALPAFRRAFHSGSPRNHRAQCRRDPSDCHYCQWERLLEGLWSGAYSRDLAQTEHAHLSTILNGVAPRAFKKIFGKGHPLFSTGEQQDAAEYLGYLLQETHRKVVSPNAGDFAADPTKIFEFVVEQRSECAKCHSVKYSRRLENLLQLPIPVSPVSIPEGASPEVIETLRPKTTLTACLNSFLAAGDVECRCENCGQQSVYRVTQRLASFPDVIVINPRREYFDHSVLEVKKLDVFLEVPSGVDYLDLELTRSVHPIGEAESVITSTHNQGPSSPETRSAAAAGAQEVDEIALATVVSMGIEVDTALWALQRCSNDVERAIDFVFSHPEGPPQPAESVAVSATPAEIRASTDGPAIYRLVSMISHMGARATTGHYVCHVQNPGDEKEWILFNDDKVAVSKDPPFRLASVYFYARV